MLDRILWRVQYLDGGLREARDIVVDETRNVERQICDQVHCVAGDGIDSHICLCS